MQIIIYRGRERITGKQLRHTLPGDYVRIQGKLSLVIVDKKLVSGTRLSEIPQGHGTYFTDEQFQERNP